VRLPGPLRHRTPNVLVHFDLFRDEARSCRRRTPSDERQRSSMRSVITCVVDYVIDAAKTDAVLWYERTFMRPLLPG
jgi:hypothetical protein